MMRQWDQIKTWLENPSDRSLILISCDLLPPLQEGENGGPPQLAPSAPPSAPGARPVAGAGTGGQWPQE